MGPGLTSPIVERAPRTPELELGASHVESFQSGSNEKSWKEKTFTEKRRTKICCGIPIWMLATVVGVVLLCGIIIGAVVGGLMATAAKR
jgi:hypothetical protein